MEKMQLPYLINSPNVEKAVMAPMRLHGSSLMLSMLAISSLRLATRGRKLGLRWMNLKTSNSESQ